MVSKKQNELEFSKYLKPILNKYNNAKLIIADGDETISVEDTSRLFFELNDSVHIWDKLRKCFKEKGRTHKGYFEVAKIYSKIPYGKYEKYCKKTATRIKFRKFWTEIIKLDIPIIIVTSGLDLLWNKIVENNKWKNVIVIGGNNFNEKKFIVTPEIKGTLLKKLKKQKNKIMAFGDSKVDRYLLRNSHLGCIVTNKRKSPGLAEELKDDKNIIQIKMDEKLSNLLPIKDIKEVLDLFYNI